MFNTQTPEKRVNNDGWVLSVHSIFHTIQGEGPFCGTPAIFIRLAGCNLQCPLCDTDYTSGRRLLTVTDIARKVFEVKSLYPTRLVVITGGEPFRQNLNPLFQLLVEKGRFFVQIETNGTLAPPEENTQGWKYNKDIGAKTGVYIVCSPKAGKVKPEIARISCAYKYVASWNDIDMDDGLPSHPLECPSLGVPRPPVGKPVYLQPTDHKDEAINKMSLQAVVASCMQHGYTLQLQIHKLIGVE